MNSVPFRFRILVKIKEPSNHFSLRRSIGHVFRA